MTTTQDSPARPRGRPFAPGNQGKPKGTRHRITRIAEELLDGEAEALTRKAIELALDGDPMALRLCLERILPPRKERPVDIVLPPLDGPDALRQASARIVGAVAAGELMPSEGEALAKLLDGHLRLTEFNDLAARIAALEQTNLAKGPGR